ncbi:hypothetical protein [Hymenobacter koreensis]|uniref:DUF4175 family protein n=1 Tax=Hymenobacter koreensis TaxID=1084523 RepID=A0ABP8IXQ5_9BACT
MNTAASSFLTVSPSVAAAQQQLHAARQRFLVQQATTISVVAAAALVLLTAVAHRWPQLNGAAVAGALAALLVTAWMLWRLRRFNPAAVARRLDRHFPELEDSTGLLLPSGSNEPETLLPTLQRQRVAERLAALSLTHALPVPALPRLAVAAVLAAAAAGLWFWPVRPVAAPESTVALRFPDAPKAAPAQPRILSTTIRVSPPTYTKRAAYTAAASSFQCPQGSVVRWTIRLSQPGPAPELRLAGRGGRVFRALANQPTVFVADQSFTASTLYQIRFAGQLSEDYAVEVIPDRAPVISMLAPRPYTLVGARRRPEIAVRVQLRDDYALTRARLVITTAQGSGEAVKFGETTTDLNSFVRAQPRAATATATLRLPALGLTFGDELYVYAETWDNAGHRARTDAHLVQWEDTAATGDLNSIALGVNPVPVYFRSQRQIIIDTEKLLAERRRLTPAQIQERANSLGEDQKVLRLRYGKFLGEEYEQSIGESARPPVAEGDEPAEEHHANDGHDHSAEPGEGGIPTAEALAEPYVHRHDDSETADFLEPQVKAKLRTVLSQMWDAELQLRLAQPAAALPFEYRALRLLKEVQQQTRAYVRKSGVDLPPLPEAEKRLTGDLSAATITPREAARTLPLAQAEVRAALAALGTYQAGQPLLPREKQALEAAGPVLAAAALRQPGTMLPALQAWRQLMPRVRSGQPSRQQAVVVERALIRLLPAPPASPVRQPANPLARRYFKELSR